MNIPQFFHLLYYRWISKLLLVWEYFEVMLRSLLTLSFGEHMYKFLLFTFLGMEWLSQIFSDLVGPLFGTRHLNSAYFMFSPLPPRSHSSI